MKNYALDSKLEFYIKAITLLLIGVIIKLFYIFLITKRGASHFNAGFPYDAYLFNPFDRFTDWLVPLAFSKLSNPWDIYSELGKSLPAVPYGPLTFIYLRFTSFLGHLFPFLILVYGYCYANYKLLNESLRGANLNLIFFLFVSLLIGYYPLHILIDRGNTAIIGLALVSLISLVVKRNADSSLNFKEKKLLRLVEFLYIFLICTKPTWGLLVLPLFFISKKSFYAVLIISLLIYLMPIIFFGVHFIDYINSMNFAYSYMYNATNFTNDIVGSISQLTWIFLKFQIDYKNFTKFFIFVGFVVLVLSFLYIFSLKHINKKEKFFLFLAHVSISTLLFNRPSPDYNLPILLPLFIVIIDIIANNQGLSKKTVNFLAFVFFMISSWGFLILGKDQLQLWVPIRSLGLIFLNIAMLTWAPKLIKSKNSKLKY
jgi:hypothetical protein